MIVAQDTIIPADQQNPGAIKNLVAQIQATSRGHESEKQLSMLARNDASLQSQLNTIISILKDTPMPGSVAATFNNPGGAIIPYSTPWTPVLSQGKYQQMTLTGNLTINVPAFSITPWQELTLILVQDGTGSRTVTFSGSYIGSPLAVDPNPGRATVFPFAFRSSDNKPFLISRPLTYSWP